MEGLDALGIQELGGFANLAKPWTTVTKDLDGQWVFYVTNPSLAFRAVAVGLPSRLVPYVDHVTAFSCGISVMLKIDGCKQFVISAHLPHRQRSDCIEVWNTFSQELEHILRSRRHMDSIVTLIDTNYELGPIDQLLDPNLADERGVIAGSILQQNGFVHTRPDTFTWTNSRGSVSKIDFVWISGPSLDIADQRVFLDSHHTLGCDHRAVFASSFLPGLERKKLRKRKRVVNKCGKWLVNAVRLNQEARSLAEHLDLNDADLGVQDLEVLSDAVSTRPKSLRYRDPPYVLDKIKHRRTLRGAEARAAAREIVALRKDAKAKWLTSVLDRSSKGDFYAISYFNRRQAIVSTHTNYIVRAGGKQRAVADLRRHFSLKYVPPDLPPPDLPHRILCAIDQPIPPPSYITVDEIRNVINTCKNGKSSGNDGISYEFLAALLSSDLAPHFADFFNSILFGSTPIPDSWLVSRLTFLPKVPLPSLPKDLRPIVLSSTPGKIFTKILLFRLRPHFPLPVANQLACIPGSQPMEGSTCLQHVVHLSQEYGLPLIAIKLDVASAFDHLSHSSVAKFLAQCGPRLESHVLLKIIVLSRVLISISDVSWEQSLLRGVVQGSSYSAEIFARTVDYFLGFVVDRWSNTESTWIQSMDPNGVHRRLFNLIYADDIILLATSYAQATRLLEGVVDTLTSIGLTLALDKCKFFSSPDLGVHPLVVRDVVIRHVSSFKFLGVLVGFNISSQAVLSARLSMAHNSFWGYYRILKRKGGPVKTRLHLLNSFVTSKWRWLSPCIRPVTMVVNMLMVVHTTLLTSLCGFASDPFLTIGHNWVSRRRASRMCAQACSHSTWPGTLASSFLGFWGHAARLWTYRYSPLTVAMGIRDGVWLQAFAHSHRRVRGYWPNCVRFLQLAYESLREPWEPAFWVDKALDRQAWLTFSTSWLTFKSLSPSKFYSDLSSVDLHGRCLLQIGDTFKLLPFRHVPVEPPYGTSFEIAPEAEAETDTDCLQVCSDGGCRAGKGSLAVTFLAPYAPLDEAVIIHGKISEPCTNIKAELLAAVQALKHIRTFLSYFPSIPFVYMTDSMLVVQALEELANITCHPSTVHELLSLWRQVCRFGRVVHVRGHKGHPQNTLTDKAATQALTFSHSRLVYRKYDYNTVYMCQPNQSPPRFHSWL